MADNSAGAFAAWTYADEFEFTPGTSDSVSVAGGSNDELHLIVIDENGLISGTPGTILEKFTGISKASDAKTAQGAANYWKTVLEGSEYIWWMDNPAGTNWGNASAGTTFDGLGTHTVSLTGGVSASPSAANVITAYDELSNAELIDVNLLVCGPHNATVAAAVIDIASTRKDCMAFVSPELADVYNNAGDEADDIIAFRNTLTSTSYAVLDSGWKYQYDKYNDLYRWIPLNADVAGLCARTDSTNDPWFSPGGLTRGQIKNVVKLAFNPDKTDRDELYKKGINPVVSFPGEGTVLFGDKTLLAKPSAFDRINVRRLFIVLEKAIATAARYQLFEFNDAFTRAQFRNLVEPFLRDVQGRRGIIDFRVICDDTNNTGEVIDRNEFIADIYIKPARSINFITLNFIATRTDVAFEEIVGA
jgi:phage tail sheath protein FI